MDVVVEKLRKVYGAVSAVQEVSFTLHKGDFVGFVGGNGAGKSTTIKLLTGQISPTEGRIFLDGKDALEDPNLPRTLIGYVPEFPELYVYLTGREMLEFVASVRDNADMEYAIEIAGLGQDLDRLIREYSQGMRRKISIACAMMSRPPVLVLDEALNGLDPSSVKRIVGLLEEACQQGTIVLLSTHVLDTLEKVASRILYIEKGVLKADAPISALDSIRQSL